MKAWNILLLVFIQTCFAKPTNNNNADIKTKVMNCDTCKAPTFHGRDFYLPFCGGEKTFPNLCEAICSTDAKETYPSKGSCDKCESKKCNQIFLPVCTLDGGRLFANKCHAVCAGVEYKDCPGLNMVIPGKTPLPPNKELPLRLQNVDLDVQDSLDENL